MKKKPARRRSSEPFKIETTYFYISEEEDRQRIERLTRKILRILHDTHNDERTRVSDFLERDLEGGLEEALGI